MKTLLIILTLLGAIVGFGSLVLMLTSSANPTYLQKLIPLIALGVSMISTLILLDTSATEIVEHLHDKVKLRRKLDDRLVEIIELQRVIKEMKIEKIQYQIDNKLPPVFYPDNLVASSENLHENLIKQDIKLFINDSKQLSNTNKQPMGIMKLVMNDPRILNNPKTESDATQS